MPSADRHRRSTEPRSRATRSKVDAAQLIDEMASTPAPAKGAHPPCELPEIAGQIEVWIEADQAERLAASNKAAVESEIIAAATPARISVCRKLGRVIASVRLNSRLTLTQTSKYSVVAHEALADLRKAFDGADYFGEETTIALTPAAAADPKTLDALLKALGPEEFRACFTVKRTAKVNESFHEDVTLIAGIERRAQAFIDQGTIRPYKPSLRA